MQLNRSRGVQAGLTAAHLRRFLLGITAKAGHPRLPGPLVEGLNAILVLYHGTLGLEVCPKASRRLKAETPT